MIKGSGQKKFGLKKLDQEMAEFKILAKKKKFNAFNEDEENSWSKPFYFIQAADCQFGLIGYHTLDLSKGKVPSPLEWPEEIALAEKSVELVNALNPPPRFFIICGDLCNAYPDSEPDIRKLQEEDFKRIYSKVNPAIPLVCVCGNHDVGEIPTSKSMSAYRTSFGDDFFSFWVGGVLFIVLNSQLIVDSSQVPELKAEQAEWLDETLAIGKARKARIIVFQHTPYFVKRCDEPADGYFNIPLEKRLPLLDKFINSGVSHVFCGHYHRNGGGFYKNLEVVATSAISLQLGSDDNGMRVVKVNPNNVEHSYHTLKDFPHTVKL